METDNITIAGTQVSLFDLDTFYAWGERARNEATELSLQFQELSRNAFPEDESWAFLVNVIAWGDGQRFVLPKFKKSNTPVDASLALRSAAYHLSQEDVWQAIECIRSLNGFGLSFASKVIRIADPSQAATLDSVLQAELSLQDNKEDYLRFLALCKSLKAEISHLEGQGLVPARNLCLADCEMIIYAHFKHRRDSKKQRGPRA